MLYPQAVHAYPRSHSSGVVVGQRRCAAILSRLVSDSFMRSESLLFRTLHAQLGVHSFSRHRLRSCLAFNLDWCIDSPATVGVTDPGHV